MTWIWFNRCAIFINIPMLWYSAWTHDWQFALLWSIMIFANASTWWTKRKVVAL